MVKDNARTAMATFGSRRRQQAQDNFYANQARPMQPKKRNRTEHMTSPDDENPLRVVNFGRLTAAGKPLVPEGSWVLTEQHGRHTTSFIALTTADARKLRDDITRKLDEADQEAAEQ